MLFAVLNRSRPRVRPRPRSHVDAGPRLDLTLVLVFAVGWRAACSAMSLHARRRCRRRFLHVGIEACWDNE